MNKIRTAECVVNRYWVSIVIASLFEILWVIGLKHASSPLEWTGTIGSIFMTFALINFASQKIPVGTTYAIFVGLGAVGTFLSDIFLFGTSFKTPTLVCLFLLLSGVIGLKMVTHKEESLFKGIKQ